jgi:flagellar assembly protein FliH
MGLIKARQAPPNLQPFSLADIETAAKRILLRARRQADELLVAAQQEAEALKELAREEGLREGREQGLAEGTRQGAEAGKAQALAACQQQFAAAVAAVTQAAAELDAGRRALEAEGLAEVVQLAAAIARRVTKRQGMIDEQVLAANVADAMRLVVHAADVRIAIHPDQRRTLDDALPRLRLEWPGLEHVELVDDPALAPGGCRIFTRGGRVDADLDGQLDRVIAELLPTPDVPPAT